MTVKSAFALLAAALATLCLDTAASAQSVPKGEIPFGVYDPPGDFERSEEVQIEHLFLPWDDVYLPSLFEADDYALKRNRAVLATVEPWTWLRSERNTAQGLIDGLESGEYDGLMRDICSVLGQMQSPVTVRWAQEMDDADGQFIWAGWKPETYIQAYRRMVNVCREVAPQANFMWSPLGRESMADFYPGDDVVDLVGLSAFGSQAYEQRTFGRPKSFVETLGPRYQRALQFNKPIVVAELGFRGDKAYVDQWNTQVRTSHDRFPELVGVVYFNQKEVYPWPDFTLPDWRVRNNVVEQK